MFTDCFCDSVNIAPESSKKKSVKNNFVQTEPVRNDDISCQVPHRLSVQIQTDSPEVTANVLGEFDVDTLSRFLNKVTPLVCNYLEKNVSSHAFDRYRLLSDVDSTTTTKLHSLEKNTLPHEFYCADISWSGTGTAIAVAYGNKTHESWCEHDSFVCIWSLNRKDFDSKKPTTVLETDCCITCVTFHPKMPAMLAVGKFNGEIILWNISKDDDPLVGSSEAIFGAHREPITGLHWIVDASFPDKIELVSCSLDGKILIWRLNKGGLEPYDGFVILTNDLPKSLEIKVNKLDAEVGITSMSINAEDPSIFIIGIEGGGIFQCSFNSTMPASYTGASAVPLKSPISMNFEKHKGQVTSIQFSSFSRNVFLSSGSDGELRIYSLLQPKPIVILQLPSGGVKSAQWSPVRPLVLSSISDDGKMHIWDISSNETSPVEHQTLSTEKNVGSCIEFNKENHQLLATSASNGEVQIWQLSSALTEFDISEVRMLQELIKDIT